MSRQRALALSRSLLQNASVHIIRRSALVILPSPAPSAPDPAGWLRVCLPAWCRPSRAVVPSYLRIRTPLIPAPRHSIPLHAHRQPERLCLPGLALAWPQLRRSSRRPRPRAACCPTCRALPRAKRPLYAPAGLDGASLAAHSACSNDFSRSSRKNEWKFPHSLCTPYALHAGRRRGRSLLRKPSPSRLELRSAAPPPADCSTGTGCLAIQVLKVRRPIPGLARGTPGGPGRGIEWDPARPR